MRYPHRHSKQRVLVKLQMAGTYRIPDGPLTRYIKLQVVQAPGMLGMCSPPPTSRETEG